MTKLHVAALMPFVDYMRLIYAPSGNLFERMGLIQHYAHCITMDRYDLDHKHELLAPTKVRGARILAQSIVNSGDTLVTQSNLDNWNDMDIIDWLEAKGYMWDADLLGWVIHIQL